MLQSHRDVESPFEHAVARIRATGYDDSDDMVLSLVEPHTAEEASTFFESMRRGA